MRAQRLCKAHFFIECNVYILLALLARAVCIPGAIAESALPTMPRKHSDADYNAAMLQEIARVSAQREEDTNREQSEFVRVTCWYLPSS